MLRAVVWTLRQPRYRAIAIFMTVLAIAFVGIGTFEVHRFDDKRVANDELRANARAEVVALSTSLVPVTSAPAPDGAAIRYRTVRVSGVYQAAGEQYLDDQRQGGRQGFLVLTPLRTSAGVLLVARGFVRSTSSGQRPDTVAAPPTGTVTVQGLLYPGQGRSQDIGRGEITAVNPQQQATRLDAPVFQAYLALTKGRPGTAGLRVLPRPDLSNPTGGAGSLQLLSYVLQWYAFALLALAAPFLLARNEVKDARRRFLGIDPDDEQFDEEQFDDVPEPQRLDGARSSDRAPVLRSRGELTRTLTPVQERGARLADRYGRSLGPIEELGTRGRAVGRRRTFVAPYQRAGGDSASAPHRSEDAYHGAYNDHLWQLALADGEVPDVEVGPAPLPLDAPPAPPPRVIDVDLDGGVVDADGDVDATDEPRPGDR